MFHLVIDYGAAVDVTDHPSREVALGALFKHLDTIDCDYRVTQASWEYSNERNCLRATASRTLQIEVYPDERLCAGAGAAVRGIRQRC